jgi:hypothetical protein
MWPYDTHLFCRFFLCPMRGGQEKNSANDKQIIISVKPLTPLNSILSLYNIRVMGRYMGRVTELACLQKSVFQNFYFSFRNSFLAVNAPLRPHFL